MSQTAALRGALEALLGTHVSLINSGDAGNWDVEAEKEVIAARAALAMKVTEQCGGEENPELCAIMIRKAFIEYRGEAKMTTDEAFIFAAGFIAGRESK
jgi:hypothetical protein